MSIYYNSKNCFAKLCRLPSPPNPHVHLFASLLCSVKQLKISLFFAATSLSRTMFCVRKYGRPRPLFAPLCFVRRAIETRICIWYFPLACPGSPPPPPEVAHVMCPANHHHINRSRVPRQSQSARASNKTTGGEPSSQRRCHSVPH